MRSTASCRGRLAEEDGDILPKGGLLADLIGQRRSRRPSTPAHLYSPPPPSRGAIGISSKAARPPGLHVLRQFFIPDGYRRREPGPNEAHAEVGFKREPECFFFGVFSFQRHLFAFCLFGCKFIFGLEGFFLR